MSGTVTPDRLMAAGIPGQAARLLAHNLVAEGATANVVLGPVPERSYFNRLLLRNRGTQSVNVGLGTTLGGTDVLNPSVPNTVPANNGTVDGTLTVDVTAFTKGSAPALSTYLIYLTFSGTTGYIIDATLIWDKGP